MSPRVAGVLLAAGQGSRLGQPKALVEIGGQRLADRGVGLLQAGGAAPVVVVTGAVTFGVPGTLVVHNPAWATGMGSSLTVGLTALRSLPPDACSAAVIALADQPLVGPESVRRLVAAHAGGASVAVAGYDGRPRNPVLIAREHWDEVLATAYGDAGARPFLRAHPDLVTLVECGDTGSPDDIDTPDDLARVTKALSPGSRGSAGLPRRNRRGVTPPPLAEGLIDEPAGLAGGRPAARRRHAGDRRGRAGGYTYFVTSATVKPCAWMCL